jgi:YD repeat-containing protein
MTQLATTEQMTEATTTDELERELAYRSGDGIDVRLTWRKADNRLRVEVTDARAGHSFDLIADPARALDVYYHPYAYAASRDVDSLVRDLEERYETVHE